MAINGIGGEDCRDPATGEFYEIGTDAALAAAGTGNCHYWNPVGAAIGASPSDPYYNHPDAWDFFWGGPETELKKSLTLVNSFSLALEQMILDGLSELNTENSMISKGCR